MAFHCGGGVLSVSFRVVSTYFTIIRVRRLNAHRWEVRQTEEAVWEGRVEFLEQQIKLMGIGLIPQQSPSICPSTHTQVAQSF